MRYSIRIQNSSLDVELLLERRDDDEKRELYTGKIRASLESNEQELESARASGRRGETAANEESRIVILERNQRRLVVSIGNKVYSISQLKRSPVSVTFVANGSMITAHLDDKTKPPGREAPPHLVSALSGAPPSEYITSTLPARVVKVNIKQDDVLEQGAVLIILESMKMEVQILAPRNCTVRDVYIKEGETIEKGKKLARLKFTSKH